MRISLRRWVSHYSSCRYVVIFGQMSCTVHEHSLIWLWSSLQVFIFNSLLQIKIHHLRGENSTQASDLTFTHTMLVETNKLCFGSWSPALDIMLCQLHWTKWKCKVFFAYVVLCVFFHECPKQEQKSLKESQGALLGKVEEFSEELKQEKQRVLTLEEQLNNATLSLQALREVLLMLLQIHYSYTYLLHPKASLLYLSFRREF